MVVELCKIVDEHADEARGSCVMGRTVRPGRARIEDRGFDTFDRHRHRKAEIGVGAELGVVETAMQRLSLDALGLLYLGVTMPFIFLLRDRPGGGQVVILAMGVTFLSDTGGYVFGRLFGKHKLYPVVSPKKTVEGVMGGVLFATGTAFLARVLFPDLGHLTALDCIVLGVVGSAFAVTGDLVESLMKRAFGVKDSGTLIPGHGGLLDRIDALLFCGPFVWVYLELLGR